MSMTDLSTHYGKYLVQLRKGSHSSSLAVEIVIAKMTLIEKH
jgi:hypothetical protein